MKNFFYLVVASCFCACSHTIDLRSAHFLTPTVSEKQWSGSIAGSGSQATKISVVDNISSNPPSRESIRINEDYSLSDMFMISYLDINFKLSVLPSLEVVMDNYTYGLKWQFLNHGTTAEEWVGAIQAAYGSKETTHSINDDRSESKLTTTRYGVSIGHAFEKIIPYVSLIQEQHKASTTVRNDSGSFGPYEDEGKHNYITVGVAKRSKGFKVAAEYNMIQIDWNGTKGYQNAVGVLMGFEW